LPLTLSALLAGAPDETRWYDRASCQKGMEAVLSADMDEAERRIKPLEASGDVEDQACGVWLRAALAETQIAVGGRLPALMENRERVLLRMFKFAKVNGPKGQHLADLEIEARMRRVRALVDKGDKGDALKEVNRTKDLLAQRKGAPGRRPKNTSRGSSTARPPTPASRCGWCSAWPAFLEIRRRGRRHLMEVAKGTSVYRYDAMYVLHHFSRENRSEENGAPVDYSKTLFDRFPTNPQFTYDLAVDLYEAKRCKDSLAVLTDARKRLETEPQSWSSTVRAKLYYITGQCSAEVGDKVTAKRYASWPRPRASRSWKIQSTI
jgi:hypothetical protein